MSDSGTNQAGENIDPLVVMAGVVEVLAPLLRSYVAEPSAAIRAACLPSVRLIGGYAARIVQEDEADTATTARAIVDAIFTAPADAEVANADVKPG